MLLILLTGITQLLWLSGAQDAIRPYPLPDAYLKTTTVLNHSSYLEGFDDQQWYLDNIPFVDFPDKPLQDVYYYRTSVIKRHLKYVHEGHGWVFTEFIYPVSWGNKFQTIPDSAAYHIIEGRWLRDPSYTKDLIQAYTRAGVEVLSGITYTHFVQRAIYENAQVTGDVDFLTSQLEGMIRAYNLWNVTVDSVTGLYHRTPLLDAQEYSLPGWMTGGPNGEPVTSWNSVDNNYTTIDLGPETYRPNFNAYMVAGAHAISEIATLAGNTSLAQTWNQTAASLLQRMEGMLYDNSSNFWIDVVEGTNFPITGRELIGYFPYRFGIGTSDDNIRGLEAGLTPEAFLTEFGPTTLEQSNPYYTSMKNTTYCCLWQGQSWPFSTSVYLGTLARIARDNRSSVITPQFFYEALTTYVRTNYKDGVPYTAEAHYPTIDMWSGDTTNHSENYFHSTYLDNIFTNLLGIVPTLDERIELKPLVPDNWTYFAVENLPYHGTLFTILWDLNGSHYSNFNHSSGLSVYSNGRLIFNQPTLSPTNITLPFSNTSSPVKTLAAAPRYVNILSNPNSPYGLPNVSADYTFTTNGDFSPYEAWKMNDGLLWYDTTPDNRWTNNQSTTPFNTINVTLPRVRSFNSISLAVFDDADRGGVIACPEAVRVTNRADGSLLAERNPWTGCVPNSLNTILFDSPNQDVTNATTNATGTFISTDAIAIQVTNAIYRAVAISEIQIWVPSNPGPSYAFADGLIGTFIGSFEGRMSGMNGTIVNGSVELGAGGWVEIADVEVASPGVQNATLSGGGNGTVAVQMNFLRNETVQFNGAANVSVALDFLPGGNVVTVFQVDGTPSVEAILVA